MGTVFVVQAQVKQRQDGPEFLYTSWQWAYEVISPEVAKWKIASRIL